MHPKLSSRRKDSSIPKSSCILFLIRTSRASAIIISQTMPRKGCSGQTMLTLWITSSLLPSWRTQPMVSLFLQRHPIVHRNTALNHVYTDLFLTRDYYRHLEFFPCHNKLPLEASSFLHDVLVFTCTGKPKCHFFSRVIVDRPPRSSDWSTRFLNDPMGRRKGQYPP